MFSNILSRYIIRQFLMAFTAVLMTLCFVVFIFDSIELIKKSAKYSYGFDKVLLMASLKLPYMIEILLPFAVLLGAVVIFFKLTKSQELVIIRAVGQSVWQFVTPLMIAAFLTGVFNMTVFNPISSKMYSKYQQLEEMYNTNSKTDEVPFFSQSSGLWLREHRDGKMYVIHADYIRQDKYDLIMRGFSILEFNDDDAFVRRVDAGEAVLEGHTFHLKNVRVFQAGKNIEQIDRVDFQTKMTLGKIQENLASPETVSFWDLPALISFFESTGFSAHTHRLRLQSLMSSPFMLMTMVMIAAVFGIPPNQRQGGTLLKIFFGVCLGFILYFVSRVTYALGVSGNLPVFIAVWTPPLVFLLITTSLLLHQEDG